MRIFISSVIHGFGAHRDATVRAARALRHEVKRSEDFAASPVTPQQACLAGVRWTEAMILLLGAKYGNKQPSGVSATHEEYREARERMPVLVFVEEGVDFEPAQRDFLREVQGWTSGHYTATFRDSDELRDAVTVALRDLELARAVGPVDEAEMLAQARALLLDDHQSLGVKLILVVSGGPRQQVLRPREIEAPELEEALTQEALFGPLRILDRTAGTLPAIRDNALVIEQENASILLDQLGTARIIVPVERPRSRGDFGMAGVAIREDVEELLQRMLRFVASALDRIDPVRRLSDVVPIVSLQGAMTWRTRCEASDRTALAIYRHGGLDMGIGVEGGRDMDGDRRAFWLLRIVGRVWAALHIYGEAVRRFGVKGPWECSAALLKTAGAALGDFGAGWAEWGDPRAHSKPCPEPNLLWRREVETWPGREETERLAFAVGAWIENSFGSQNRRFLAHDGRLAGKFDWSKYR